MASVALALAAIIPLAHAETVQKDGLRVRFEGQLRPTRLPRHGEAPVTVRVGGRISTTDGSDPPQLRRIEIAINRFGQFDYRGLPSCRSQEIQPATTANALRACPGARVGSGTFTANVAITGQAPFPSRGEIVAFNGREDGHAVILAHIYGTDPVPTSFTLPLRLTRRHGTFGTLLKAALPAVTSKADFVTGIELTLSRKYRYRGSLHSFVNASCPAPAGFRGAVFPLARVSMVFADRRHVSETLTRSCTVRR